MFEINGPYKLTKAQYNVPDTNMYISFIDKKQSMKRLHHFAGNKVGGVYLFAIRPQRSAGTIWYVGKNENKSNLTLLEEAFSKDKLKKYALALAEQSGGTPIMYFLKPIDSRSDDVDSLEQFLIWLARQSNPALLNKRKVHLSPKDLYFHLQKHKIKGILGKGTGSGRASKAELSFRKTMRWDKVMHVSK